MTTGQRKSKYLTLQQQSACHVPLSPSTLSSVTISAQDKQESAAAKHLNTFKKEENILKLAGWHRVVGSL